MQTLHAHLRNLFLIEGETTVVTSGQRTRAIVIAFPRYQEGAADQHWTLLCEVANALQTLLKLPAPVVSVSSVDGFALWLSLQAPISTAEAAHFGGLLRAAYFADTNAAVRFDAQLPPYLDPETGKWAAFIHPGLGASFAEDAGLDMAPPEAGQVALLEHVHSVSAVQLQQAIALLEGEGAVAAPLVSALLPAGLLLKDATLDEIVRHLHSKNIEPTFRYVMPK